ncbi:hypothetical protein [Pontibacter rugosus]|uniref:STAS/SEC14 domain-containing protein n=1 Tax=Pontibacter rugosus TaxID=1745966 RepID=A0ABW3ST78_9BACT
MNEYKELKKANGDVFCEVTRMSGNAYVFINWIGIQSLETVVIGGNYVLSILRAKPCSMLLNSNRELIGPWETAINWWVYKWAPQAKDVGVRYFAHVLSPGIYGQRSFHSLYPQLKMQLEVKPFEDEEGAKEWLQTKSF